MGEQILRVGLLSNQLLLTGAEYVHRIANVPVLRAGVWTKVFIELNCPMIICYSNQIIEGTIHFANWYQHILRSCFHWYCRKTTAKNLFG